MTRPADSASAVGRRALLGLVLVLVAAVASPGTAAPPPGIVRTPEFVSAVDAAIRRGVDWLWSQETADGWAISLTDRSPMAAAPSTALAVATLRACGTSRADPRILRRLRQLRATYDAQKAAGQRSTYTVSLMCLAAQAQATDGPRATTDGLAADDRAWIGDMAAWLEATMGHDDRSGSRGAWSYGGGGSGYDHSNTQYAVLGLDAARRSGAAVAPETWRAVLDHHLRTQERDGPPVERHAPPGAAGATWSAATDRARGWTYRGDRPAYGSMTAGGVASVAICRAALAPRSRSPSREDARADRSVRDGIAWLGSNFSVRVNPGPPDESSTGPAWLYYHLYAVERAGVLAEVDWFGAHDWYREGAEFLVRAQWPSGAWLGADLPDWNSHADTSFPYAGLNTCWALLFLRRGTVRTEPAARTQSARESALDFAAAATLSDAQIPELIDLVLERWQHAASDAARAEILGGATSVGPRILDPCIRRLSSPAASVRRAADALLRRATGIDCGYEPDAAREAREAAVDRWTAWLMANASRLRYDPDRCRIACGERGR